MTRKRKRRPVPTRHSSAPQKLSYLGSRVPQDAFASLARGDMSAWMVNDEKQRDAARDAILAQEGPAERDCERLLGELNALLLAVDPVALYSQLHVLDSMRRNAVDANLAFGSDAMLEFLGGLVTAMDPDEITVRLGRDFHPQMLFDADRLLRDLAQAEHRLFVARQLRQSGDSHLEAARFMLGLERRYDRMQGYVQHLERIYAHILQPLDQVGRKHLGFAPAIVLQLAKAQIERVEERFRDVQEGIGAHLATLDRPQSREERVQAAAVFAAGLCRFGAPRIEENLAGELASMTSLPEAEVVAAIEALSVSVGDQPAVIGLAGDIRVRLFPIIAFPDGQRLWPRPIDLAHSMLDWCAAVCEPFPELRAAYDRSRQRGCEELAAEALEAVFTSRRVQRNPTYDSPGRPDTDVLVTLPGACIVAEAKGRRFTEAGRAGLPRRVATKAAEFVHEPLTQSERAASSLRNDPTSWRDASGRPLNLTTPAKVLRIAVTLERVDPFATMVAELATHSDDDAALASDVWMVALADLLAVADILETPHEMFAYIDARSRITQRGYPTVMMETDALAAWCSDRLADIELPTGVRWMLSYQSEALNKYFTSQALGESAKRPSSGLPSIVLRALDQILVDEPAQWLAACTDVMAPTTADWKPVSRSLADTATASGGHRRSRQRAHRLSAGVSIGGRFTLQLRGEHDAGTSTPATPALVITTTDDGTLPSARWKATQLTERGASTRSREAAR